ncbi:hypothetical protein B7P43_G12086 [Cryptotermes secundus]|uniref:Uncharacterized protein n=1 Tax=Cryptotermes secundus TaxID=105785 RepID=A0A2J7PHD4_9NEOP|nr:hypothetical protein B7P43_G12086 [Cryptotermes secundus]
MLSVLLSPRLQKLQIFKRLKPTALSKEKRTEDHIGLEMVNILKSSLQSRQERERNV